MATRGSTTILELKKQGGARVKVKEVEILEMDTEDLEGGIGFETRSLWKVKGTVGHWGHIHKRINQYEAILTVEPVDKAWKLTKMEVVKEERLPLR